MRATTFLRRACQFRLRTLLLAISALCLALGWYVRRVELQRKAVAAVRAAGGTVDYDYQFVNDEEDIYDFATDEKAVSSVPDFLRQRLGEDYFHGIDSVAIQPGTVFDKAVLAHLVNLPRLKLLCVEAATDDDLKTIGRSSRLRGLVITRANAITDEGIGELRRLRNLEMLALHGSNVTDKSTTILATLPELRTLRIVGRIGSKGLAQICQMKKLRNLVIATEPDLIVDADLHELLNLTELENLMLSGIDISDDGYSNFQKFQKLKGLYLLDSSSEDIARLRRSMPGCKINP